MTTAARTQRHNKHRVKSKDNRCEERVIQRSIHGNFQARYPLIYRCVMTAKPKRTQADGEVTALAKISGGAVRTRKPPRREQRKTIGNLQAGSSYEEYCCAADLQNEGGRPSVLVV